MATYNGHKNWAHWNVSLWLHNDESLYQWMLNAIGQHRTRNDAALAMKMQLTDAGITHTPDGAAYSATAIRAAMRS